MKKIGGLQMWGATGCGLLSCWLLALVLTSSDGDRDPLPVRARPAAEPATTGVRSSSLAASPQKSPPLRSNGRVAGDGSSHAETVLLPRPDLAWQKTAAEPEFARFQEWVGRYQQADSAGKAALEAEGVQLAAARREALREMIASDPERALVLSVPVGIERAMPASVQSQLEQRVSGKGSLDVFGALPEAGREGEVTPTFRKATVAGRTFDAFVYGRRLGEPTRRNVALNGVAVDGRLAVNENPVRLLDPEEAAGRLPSASDAICSVSGDPALVNGTPVPTDVAGETFVLCDPEHLFHLNQQVIQAEIAAAGGDGDDGSGPTLAASVRTEGTKRLILIRVDFSDLSGAPFTDTTGANLISGLNDYFMESSYGRSGFSLNGQGSVITTTLRMPRTAGYYGASNAFLQLRTDARAAATDAGHTLSNYDYDLICFGNVPGWNWAGLGYVGAAGVWLRNYFTVGVAGHELGHNYGLNHANFWETGGQSTIGAGSSTEYGDTLDTMGSANGGSYHFNARYKNLMNWIRADEVANVTASGVYRIFAHDDSTTTGLRGLKVARSFSTNYWVEFRQKFTSNKWLMSGAGIRWAGNGNEKSHLLDTTPGSPDGRNDAALVLGRTFADSAAGVYITTLRKGGTTPESIDVAVNLGTFPGNTAPTVTVDPQSTTTGAGAALAFTADAADGNGDALAYYWDFGDGTFGTNGAAASKAWSSAGQYVVRCVVSDMKGGEASDSVVITVGSPSTYSISGTITANGSPVGGVRVSVSSTKVTYTDSSGVYTLTGLSAGAYTVSAALVGYTFSVSGFSNPVSVGPSRTGMDFSGEADPSGGGTASLTSPPNNATYTAPANVSLAASATASPGQIVSKVEFYQGTTKLGEDSTSPYTFTWSSAAAGSYTLRARTIDTLGLSATSAPVNITVFPQAPTITSQPQGQSIAAGGNVTFTVGVSGSAPFTYRWRLNGTNLAGAISSSLSLNNVQPGQAGSYSVVITNAAGSATSSSANLTVTCNYTLSSSSHAVGSAGGNGSVGVTTAGGCTWTVEGVPSWITITSGNGGTGNGTVSYTISANTNSNNRSATLEIGGRNYTISQGAPDLTRPTVAFSSPSASATITNIVVHVTGTANDNDGIARVDIAVGAETFATATGTEAWTASVTLQPGTNIVSVRSVDLSGNISATNTRALFCTVPSSLNLEINGAGNVSGATNGQKFPIGKILKVTAVPLSGYVFSNWTGNVSGSSPTLTFLMESNLQVVANFVANPFSSRKGAYNGLFYEDDQVRLGQSGAFTFALSDKGTYSAALQIGSKKTRASGKLNLEGRATNVVNRPGTNALTIVWSVALDGSDEITGTVSDGDWTADLAGDRGIFNKTNAAPQAGAYTLVLLGTPGGGVAPEGDSYGTASVDAKGVVKWKAFLADKTTISGKVPLSKDGECPLYAPLHGGKGAFLGWIAFADQSSSDFEGLISWIKPALPATPFYPGGFNSEAALLGSRYVAPVGNTNRILSLTNSVVLLSGGNLSVPHTNDVVLGFGGKVTNAGPNTLTMSFNPGSGLFKGTFKPAGATKAVPFKGVAVQKANYATGHFHGTNESGRVALEALPISPSARQLLLTQ